MDLQTVRDWVIIVYGIFGIVTFLVITIVTALIGYGVMRLLSGVNNTVESKVGPTIDSIRQTSESVRGGATFVIDAAVAPVIRAYGVVSGVRRGIAVFSGLRRRRSG